MRGAGTTPSRQLLFNMNDPNPYRSPADAGHHPTNQTRVRATVLAIVLLDVGLSTYRMVQNLSDLLNSPDSSTVLTGGTLVFWIAWLLAELFAAMLIWRGHLGGRWILVASFGLKALGHVGVVLPLLFRTPHLILTMPFPMYSVLAVCYCAAAVWLLLLPAFEKRAGRSSGVSGHLGSDD